MDASIARYAWLLYRRMVVHSWGDERQVLVSAIERIAVYMVDEQATRSIDYEAVEIDLTVLCVSRCVYRALPHARIPEVGR